LIAYLEILEEQWFELISNSLRASNLLFVLHEYLRKKIVCKNVNVASRKIVKEAVRQMKAMKTKSHLKSQNKSDHKQKKKQSANNKRFKNDYQNEIQLITIVTANFDQKKDSFDEESFSYYLLHMWQVETLQVSMSQWRHRQAIEKKQRSIDIIHVLTIRKRVRENSHLWTSMIFVISTNNERMLTLIDNDFNQNFIDQRLVYEWRLRSDENSSTNSQTMNETSLRVFRSHFLEFSSEENDERIFKIKQNLISIHMMSVDVILKMFWLRKMNFQMNWITSKWRFRENSSTSSNSSRVAASKRESEDLKNESSNLYIV
jgi:hypothetical protein